MSSITPEDSFEEGDILTSLQETLPLLPAALPRNRPSVAGRVLRNGVKRVCSGNRVSKAVKIWLERMDKYSEADIQHIIEAEPWNHQVYHPLLLLGSSTFKSETWHNLSNDEIATGGLSTLYNLMCSATKCTHIAINGPIPLTVECSPFSKAMTTNVMRSPSRLVPLHGEFGSRTDVASKDTFEVALWASATQNGIHQIFDPMHTMFSRGNIKEKARILRLAQVEIEIETEPYSAVDLYAGIGYFAFSYAKGGASVVLGWEINDWSVEGFRRGAGRNGWDVKVHHGSESNIESLNSWMDSRQGTSFRSPKLVIFAESNEAAPERVESLRNTIPPVRHVNCGYLPSSSGSWWSAMQCLDQNRGGYIHVHENIRVECVEARGLEIRLAFESLLKKRLGDTDMAIKCTHVERVKSYAPGVWHCVFDMYVSRQDGRIEICP